MEKTEFKPIIKVYKRTCREKETYIYYRMLLHRISCHLSPEEVSFLMGKPNDYVKKVETFKIKSVLTVDLYIMHLSLELESMSWMFQMGIVSSDKDTEFELHIIKMEDRVIYQMQKFDVESNQNVIEFKLIDIRHDLDQYNSTESELKDIKSLIDEQLIGGYFNEERTGAEIHKLCCSKLEKYIKPRNVMMTLQPLIERKEGIRIIRKKSDNFFVFAVDLGNKD